MSTNSSQPNKGSQHQDPGYFEMPIDEALRQAGTQMKRIIEETNGYQGNNAAFWKHQILEMADVVSFLGALVAAQYQQKQPQGEAYSETVLARLNQLAAIDEIILKASEASPINSYTFTSLVNQKTGLHDAIRQETGLTAYWTAEGYKLR